MNPIQFRACWMVQLLLDWVPGYCRFYTVRAGQFPRWETMDRHWGWQKHAQWGFRLLSHLDLIDDYADEAGRRYAARNRSSAS